MTEIIFKECNESGYAARTELNASADVTLAIAIDFSTAGERATMRFALNQHKKYISMFVPTDLCPTAYQVGQLINILNSVSTKTLNIAGNGIYTLKKLYTQQQIDEFVYTLLYKVISSDELKTKIELIRTGGQTGLDEAGAKAGVRLNIPTLVLAPKKWKFRTIDGVDIADEKRFKERFNINS